MRQQPDKQLILDSLAAIARGAGRPPSSSEFFSISGISEHSVSQFFPSWNAALRAAGLPPYTLNLRLEDREPLEDWGYAVRRNRAIPARRAYRHLGKFDHRTFERRFGPWSQLPNVFRNFARGKPEWADVLALLPVPAPKPSPKPLPNSPVAQALLPVRSSPSNKDGAPSLQPPRALPPGKVRFGPQRWQRVHLEFEFESRNFRDHGHSFTGCDVIVCWRHNWPDCPHHLEILELSSLIKSLPTSKP